MIDGKLLDALVAVVRLRSFEKAARHLGVTQSAISQRIQSLEESVGRPLVIRARDGEPTAAGEHMLRYAQQVEALELDAMAAIGRNQVGRWARLPIAINADSLATWFKPALDPLMHGYDAVVELVVSDQSETIEQLRAGTVVACVSSWSEAIQGCSCEYLGQMIYKCVATPEAISKSSGTKLDRKLAAKLPAVIFGRRDDIVAEYLKSVLDLESNEYPCHVVPSTADLLGFVLSGYGYSLLPALQIETYLSRRKLVDINPKVTHAVDLYWHKWKISTELIDALTENVQSVAKKHLSKR